MRSVATLALEHPVYRQWISILNIHNTFVEHWMSSTLCIHFNTQNFQISIRCVRVSHMRRPPTVHHLKLLLRPKSIGFKHTVCTLQLISVTLRVNLSTVQRILLRTHSDSMSPWMSLNVSECHYVSVNISECHSVSMNVTTCQWMSLNVTMSHWMSLLISKCHYVSVNVTACQWMSLHVSECHYVSVNVTTCQ